jgi:glutamyl-tRNAGlu reductase-like protein
MIPESALPEALVRLKSMPGLTEGLIVSTCNRTEFYVTGEFRDSSAPAFFESFYRDFLAGDETHLFRLWASSCSTVELVKLVSRRFTEFLQRIFYVQICAVANFLGGHIGALVRFNNVFDRVHCGLNNLLRGV